MASIGIAYGKWHGSKPIMAVYTQTENVESSASAARQTNTGAVGDQCVEVTAVGSAVWITLDGTTDAAVPVGGAINNGAVLIPDGATRHFDAGFGTNVSVINDS